MKIILLHASKELSLIDLVDVSYLDSWIIRRFHVLAVDNELELRPER